MFSNKKISILILLLTVTFQIVCSKDVWEKDKALLNHDSSSEYPLNIDHVVGDARYVFGTFVEKMLAKKRLLGFDANKWYW